MTDTPRELETYKAQLQIELEDHKARIQNNLEVTKAVFDFANITIRSLVLVNGGAAIGVLTFLASLWTKDPDVAKPAAVVIGQGLKGFVAGLAFALFTAAFSYLAQVMFSEVQSVNRKWWWGNGFRLCALLMAILSFCGFWYGAWKCQAAFTTLPIH